MSLASPAVLRYTRTASSSSVSLLQGLLSLEGLLPVLVGCAVASELVKLDRSEVWPSSIGSLSLHTPLQELSDLVCIGAAIRGRCRTSSDAAGNTTTDAAGCTAARRQLRLRCSSALVFGGLPCSRFTSRASRHSHPPAALELSCDDLSVGSLVAVSSSGLFSSASE